MNDAQRAYLAEKIIRLHFLYGLSQQAIAKRLNISASTTCRLIAWAKKRGMVRIEISDIGESFSDLEIAIEKKYNLLECLIVRDYADINQRFKEMGFLVGAMISRLLEPGDVLGIGWGQTLKGIADYLKVENSLHLLIIPTIGAMGRIETGIYPNSIAARFAKNCGSQNYLVNFPHRLETVQSKIALQKDAVYKAIEQQWKKMRCAIISNSDLEPYCTLFRYGVLNEQEFLSLKNDGAVYTSNGHFLDINGNIIETKLNRRIMTMGINDLRKLEYLVQVVTGPEKIKSTKAVLKAGLGNILITDSSVAEALLKE